MPYTTPNGTRSTTNGKVIITLVTSVYTVKYNPGDYGGWNESSETTNNLYYGDPTPAFSGSYPPTSINPSFEFYGWLPSIQATVTGDQTYTAQWRARQFILTFDPNGGTAGTVASKFVTYNLAVGDIPTTTGDGAPTRTGYTFMGWSTTSGAGNTVDFSSSTIYSWNTDISVYAVWQAHTYTISYNGNGGSGYMSNQTAIYGSNLQLTSNTFVRQGYTFTGWSSDGANSTVEYTDGQSFTPWTLTSGLTLTAVWTPKTYTVYFNTGTVTDGGTYQGYWWSDAVSDFSLTTGTKTYTIPSVANVKWNDVLTIPPRWLYIDATDYYFSHWQVTANGINSNPISGNVSFGDLAANDAVSSITITAFWDKYKYHVYLDYDDGTPIVTVPVANSSSLITLPVPAARTGYTLTTGSEWKITAYNEVAYNNGDIHAATTAPSYAILADDYYTAHSSTYPETVTLTVKRTPTTHTVVFYGNGNTGGSMSNQLFTYNVAQNLTSNSFVRTGYSFAGWDTNSVGTTVVYADGQSVMNLASTNGATVTLYAVWTPNTYSITYTPTWTTAPSPSNPTSYTITTPTITLNPPTRNGYTFTGWNITSDSLSVAPMLNVVHIPTGTYGNLTATPQWSINNYSITYVDALNAPNPTPPNPTTYRADTSFVMRHPVKKGYTFQHWYITSDSAGVAPTNDNVVLGTYGNLTATAVWTKNIYTITYINNWTTAPSPANPATYSVDTPTITLNPPTRNGYTFTGWNITSDSASITPMISVVQIPTGTYGNLTATPQWSTNAYAIYYHYNGGTPNPTPNPTGYNMGDPAITLNPPSRTGFTFNHWSFVSDSASVTIADGNTIPSGVYGNITCTVHWDTIYYPITYTLNGGTAVNPSSYNTTQTFTLNNPTRAGKTFTGWTGSNGSTKQLTVTIPTGTTGALSYTAHWNFDFEDIYADDTLFQCDPTPPITIHSGHDGLNYKWTLPDGSIHTTPDLTAATSGKYVLETNYGTLTTVDSIVVIYGFEHVPAVVNISTTPPKPGYPQTFTVVNKPAAGAVYTWTLAGGVPSTATGDTVTVVYPSAGGFNAEVSITVTVNGMTCTRTADATIAIVAAVRGLFVDKDATSGAQNGSSWTDAYLRVEDALAHALPGDFVWVAEGVYSPPAGTSYRMLFDSIAVYGGFGGWEDYLYERDFAAYPTVLRGSGLTVIANTNIDGGRWDGFIIEGGKATDGAGICNINSSTVIANSIIRGNAAQNRGGGILNDSSSPVIYNVEISGNTAREGAAMYNLNANPQLTNLTVSGNLASSSGGGIANSASNPVIRNTIIWDNRATAYPNIANASSSPHFSYSIIEQSGGSEKWNTTFGIDGTHNYDANPVFVKKGFDTEGAMQQGDYNLRMSSAAIDRGRTAYVYNWLTLWNILLPHTLQDIGPRSLEALPFDLAFHERIGNDIIDIGAYEAGTEEINVILTRAVTIPKVEGVETSPAAGVYYVLSSHDFIFTVHPSAGYSLSSMRVATNIPLRDKEGLVRQVNSDGSISIIILSITEPITIDISNIIRTSANDDIKSERVYTIGRELHIETTHSSEAHIFNTAGQLYKRQKVGEGETVVTLTPGVYIVLLDGRSYKVVIR
ncbi:MAG: InlB B-repeat-containing protein [Tannerella sp.]|nr:InlB B-repeat-containing protein [Tannerella sp.]